LGRPELRTETVALAGAEPEAGVTVSQLQPPVFVEPVEVKAAVVNDTVD
jgi:hypothetical protein